MAEEGEEQKELFDVLIPPGVPRTIIVAVLRKYDVTLVKRTEKLNFANMDGTERELLAFRGKQDVVVNVEKFMIEELRKFVEKSPVEDTGSE
ncbi:MAG: hypothetical protein LUO93_11280 [Methanomicrobiales archaeon]|nr:hypothetical protein [Methanomicrobiales archaeon]